MVTPASVAPGPGSFYLIDKWFYGNKLGSRFASFGIFRRQGPWRLAAAYRIL